MNTIIRRTARLRAAGPHGLGRGNRLLRRGLSLVSLGLSLDLNPATLALADGAAIESWTDAAQGLVLTQAVGGQCPTVQTGEINGLPVARFDGTDDEIRVAVQGSALVQADAATIYLVYKPDSTDPDDNIRPFSWATGALNELGFWGAFGGTDLYFDYGDVTAGGRITDTAPGGFLDAYHIVELWRSGSAAEIVVDGVLVASGTMTDSLDVSGTDDFIVGVSDFAGGQGKFDLARLAIAARGLTASERAHAWNVLMSLYTVG